MKRPSRRRGRRSRTGSADAATVVRGPWSVGIVGLVAARLAEDSGRPAVVGADLGDLVRASCRSDGSLDLGAALERCADLFIRYGGHAGAAGFELPAERWHEFRERFLRLAAELRRPTRASRSRSTWPSRRATWTTRLYRELAGAGAVRPGNPDPLVAVLGLTVTRVRAATGGHTQLTLRRTLDVLDGIAFGRADIAETVHEGDRLDVVARLTSRSFGGFESLQLDIRDVATSGSHRRDGRSPGRPGRVAHPGRQRIVTRPSASRQASARGSGWDRRGSLAGARSLDRRSCGRRRRDPQPAQQQHPVRRAARRTATGTATARRDPGAVERRRRAAGVVSVPGSIVYAKAGNIWIQTGKDAQQLTRAATTRCRRGRPTAARSTSSGPSTARVVARRGHRPRLPDDDAVA